MDLRTMIRARGLKQEWVAEQIDILPSRFSRMVNGKLPVPDDKLSSLARALRYPLWEVRLATAREAIEARDE
jgi:predicted XRE-type DNA-binding protein